MIKISGFFRFCLDSLVLVDGEEKTWCNPQLSNEKRAPGCLGYIGDYTAQLCGDYNKPLQESL